MTSWKAANPETFLSVTNFSTLKEAQRSYKRSMWLKEMLGEFKRDCFDLASSHSRRFLCLSRPVFLVPFLYVWLIALGSPIIKRNQRRLRVTPNAAIPVRRIGLRTLESWLDKEGPLLLALVPYPSQNDKPSERQGTSKGSP